MRAGLVTVVLLAFFALMVVGVVVLQGPRDREPACDTAPAVKCPTCQLAGTP